MAQYIYGRNAVAQALASNRVLKVFLALGFNGRDLMQKIEERHIVIERQENEWLNRLVGVHHQGIVAVIRPYDFIDLDVLLRQADSQAFGLLLILDSIQDPQNFGAIIRNAEAFGAAGIIIKKDRQVGLTATVAKVSAGSIEHVAIAQVINLSQTIKQLKQAGYWIVSTAIAGAIDYRSFDYKRKIALIVGSEGDGVSPLLLKNSDVIVQIPMVGQINSINASAASAVLLSHIHSQRFPL